MLKALSWPIQVLLFVPSLVWCVALVQVVFLSPSFSLKMRKETVLVTLISVSAYRQVNHSYGAILLPFMTVCSFGDSPTAKGKIGLGAGRGNLSQFNLNACAWALCSGQMRATCSNLSLAIVDSPCRISTGSLALKNTGSRGPKPCFNIWFSFIQHRTTLLPQTKANSMMCGGEVSIELSCRIQVVNKLLHISWDGASTWVLTPTSNNNSSLQQVCTISALLSPPRQVPFPCTYSVHMVVTAWFSWQVLARQIARQSVWALIVKPHWKDLLEDTFILKTC